jgi:transcriptional regulator with XRE-family HTH domain
MTGKQLKELRQSIGLTQAQLAKAIGVHWNTIARWERGKQGSHEDDPDGRKISAPHARLIKIICEQHRKN